jgi:hypothetical protein
MIMVNKRPKWVGWRVPEDIMIFWWPVERNLDTYDSATHASCRQEVS